MKRVANHGISSLLRGLVAAAWVLTLAACGSGGDSGGGGGGVNAPVVAPGGLAAGFAPQALQFSWAVTAGAAWYEMQEDPDGAGGPNPYAAIGGAIVGTSFDFSLSPQWLHRRVNASYRVRACNNIGCGPWSADIQPDLTQAIGYFKASNTQAQDFFGYSIALSADGRTMAVGASQEDSGVVGDQADNSALDAGAVYVFMRTGGAWAQQAYIKASTIGAGDNFGYSVGLSGDGNTLAVGAPGEDGSAITIGGDETDNTASNAGAAYVFTRTGGAWSQQAYIKSGNTAAGNALGGNVALSTEGNTLAASAGGENASAGAAYVFTRTGGAWSQQARVAASNAEAGDAFGSGLALSGDGNTLAAGAIHEDSNAVGVNYGNQGDNSMVSSGAVYVFTRTGIVWSQQAYVKASNTDAADRFGYGVALSAHGDTMAVTAVRESSSARGVNGDQSNNLAVNAGAAYVFTRAGGVWTQQAYIKASNADAQDNFGWGVALTGDGNTLAVGARQEQGNARGIGGDESDNSGATPPNKYPGAAYVFTRTGGLWTQSAYVKASNTDVTGRWGFFGYRVALAADGSALAVGALEESSSATGIGGDPADHSADSSGAVYLY